MIIENIIVISDFALLSNTLFICDNRAITCWSSSRKPVKYTNYKPLRNKDNEDGDAVSSGTNETQIGYDTTVTTVVQVSDNTITADKMPNSTGIVEMNKIKTNKKKNISKNNNHIHGSVSNTRSSSITSICASSDSDDSDCEANLVIGLAEKDHFRGAWWFGLRNN